MRRSVVGLTALTLALSWTPTVPADVKQPPDNHPPVIVTPPPTEATVGDPYIYEISAQDPDGDPMAIDLVEAPDGMMLDPQTGVIPWTPGPFDIGTYTVEIQVYDCFGASTSQTWQVTVAP